MSTTDQTVNFNHDYSQCIQSASHFGWTQYMNICDGSSHVVRWGGVDWTLCIGGLAFAVVMIGLFSAFGIMIVRDLKD